MKQWLPLELASVLAVALNHFATAADFWTNPRLVWTQDLALGTTTTRGNAVTLSPDDSRLFVTTQQGELHVLLASDPSNVEISRAFVPNYGSDANITCTSGAALFPSSPYVSSDNQQQLYAVYAIQELDQGSSNIIAVDPRTADKVWNIRLHGSVAGSPVVNPVGNRIYVTHNTQDAGFVSVIAVDDDFQSATLLETLSNSDFVATSMAPLTPPTLQTIIVQDNDDTMQQEFQDIVVFAEMNTEAPETGSLYMLVSNPSSADVNSLSLRLASEYPKSARTRPALSKDGTRAYLGQVHAHATGWDTTSNNLAFVVDATTDNAYPAWEQQLDDESDSDDPWDNAIPSTPLLSSDESLLFVTTAGTEPAIYALDVANGGSVAWSMSVGGILYVADPVLAVAESGEERLHFMERDGALRQFDATSGSPVWRFAACDERDDASCAVQAHFAVTTSANTLYFAYTNGTVAALQVADFGTDAPSAFPTMTPLVSGLAATIAPTLAETEAPSQHALRGAILPTIGDDISDVKPINYNDADDSKKPSLAFILGTVCGALGLCLVLTMYIRFHRSITGKRQLTTQISGRGPSQATSTDKTVLDKGCRHRERSQSSNTAVMCETRIGEGIDAERNVASARKVPQRLTKTKLAIKQSLTPVHLEAILEYPDDEEQTLPSTALSCTPPSERRCDQDAVFAVVSIEMTASEEDDAQQSSITTPFDMAATATATAGRSYQNRTIYRSLSNQKELKLPSPLPVPAESYCDSIARGASPIYISDMMSIDSSLYYDDYTVATEGSNKHVSTLLCADSILSTCSNRSVRSHPADELPVCSSAPPAASISITARQGVPTAICLGHSTAEENVLRDEPCCLKTSATKSHPTLPYYADEISSNSLGNDATAFVAAPELASPMGLKATSPKQTEEKLPDTILVSRSWDAPVIDGLQRSEFHPRTPIPNPYDTDVGDLVDGRNMPNASNRSLKSTGSTSFIVANSARPKAGLFTRHRQTPENYKSSGNTGSLSNMFEQAAEVKVGQSCLYGGEAQAVHFRQHTQLTPHARAADEGSMSLRPGRAHADSCGQRATRDPIGNEASLRDAWSSFVEELVKVQDQFFNPRLDNN